MEKAALILLVLLFCTSSFAQEIENSMQAQSVKANVAIGGTGSITGNIGNNPVQIEILSFVDTPEQEILSLKENLEINGKQVTPKSRIDRFGNRYALFEINETGSFSYEIKALVETNVMFPKMADFNLKQEITEHKSFIEPSENIESGHESIRTLAVNRFPSDSWLESAAEVTEWTNKNVEYDLAYYPETYSAITTLNSKKGVCDEYAVLSASVLRAKGIPVRVLNGISFNSREEQGWNKHAWLEAFNPTSGWISLDSTFGEAGTVDGTHIVRGYSTDPSKASVSKVTAARSASVEIEENSLDVKVISFKNFEEIFSLEADNVVMPANQWHSVEVKAKNNLNGKAIGWFSLVMPQGFAVQDQKRLVVFKTGEEKLLEWQVRLNQKLGKNEQLVGTYRAISIGSDLTLDLKVRPGEQFEEEAVLNVADLVPIMDGTTLVVEITLENLGAEGGTAEVSLDAHTQTVWVGAFESREVSISVENVKDKEYLVSARGPGLDFQKAIKVEAGTTLIVPDKTTGQAEPKGILEQISSMLFTFEAAIVASIAIAIVVIALLLISLWTR
jgi:transglutaminase-like putative cysteine protease